MLTVDRHVIAIERGCHGSIPEAAGRTSADGGESFALTERTMGVAVAPGWLDAALRTVRLTSPSDPGPRAVESPA